MHTAAPAVQPDVMNVQEEETEKLLLYLRISFDEKRERDTRWDEAEDGDDL